MTEFETLQAERIDFNMGGEFLELSINVARSGKRETRYLRLARGFYDEEGNPRYKRGGTTLPASRETLGQLSEALKNVDLGMLESPAEGASDE